MGRGRPEFALPYRRHFFMSRECMDDKIKNADYHRMELSFSIERPNSTSAVSLIRELDEALLELYPGQWIHTLHPEDVTNPGLIFVVAYLEKESIACGALRPLGSETAEVKRMFVRAAHRGRGYSRRMLEFLESKALASGYHTLRLETGTKQKEAVGLYESAGYHTIPSFGEYVGNPYSLCYEKELSPKHDQ